MDACQPQASVFGAPIYFNTFPKLYSMNLNNHGRHSETRALNLQSQSSLLELLQIIHHVIGSTD